MSRDHGPQRPLSEYREYPLETMRERVQDLADDLSRRRTVRDFSDRELPQDIIDAAVRAAGSAPSGANTQPWHFVVVRDAATKARIREAAEAEEQEFYTRRAPQQWLDALAPLGTDANKPFLERAPVLIAVFYERFGVGEDGEKYKTYYSLESVGLACGMLIAALHRAGLATLTHTPSPMKFLREILKRPRNEAPFLLLVVGYPEADATVPDIQRKSLDQIMTVI